MNIILTSSNFIFPLITYSYVARILLPSGTGKVAFVQSILSYFMYISALGIADYGTRECAKVRHDKEALSQLTQELLIINLISTLFAYIVLIITIVAIPKFHDYISLFVIMSSSIILQALGMEWLYRALEKYTYITVRSLIFKTIAVGLTFLFVRTPKDYVAYGAITIFTTSASNILNFVNSRKYVEFSKRKKYCLAKHKKPIMTFFFSVVFIAIYGNFDIMMLGFLKGDNEVGIYNATLKMKALILSVSTAITSVLIPRMSVYFSQKRLEEFLTLLLKSLQITLSLLVPLTVFVMLRSEDVLLLVCGDRFLSAKPTLIIMMTNVFALSLTNLLGNQVLVPKGDEKWYSLSVFIGMFINLGLNYALIPGFASAGAAIAILATESFNVVFMGFGCKNEIQYLYKNIQLRKYILSIIPAIIICLGMRLVHVDTNVFFQLCLFAIPYFGIYYSMLIIQKESTVISVISILKKKIFINRTL